MSTFVTPPFSVEAASQRGSATIRVEFTSDPLAVSSSGVHDALNPLNYSIEGPGTNYILGIDRAEDEPQSVDITMAAPLLSGDWTVTVSDVQTPASDILTGAVSATFVASLQSRVDPVTGGYTNDSVEDFIRSVLSPAMKGKFVDAMIAAMAVGDKMNWDNAKLAFDQLFKSSASGIYLDRKNADDGLQRPSGLGMSDELFRRFGIKLTNNKLTSHAILEILEVFYGADAVRAFAVTGLPEPYDIAPGETVEFKLDEKQSFSVVFSSEDFATPGAGSAIEVATAITNWIQELGSNAYAVPYKDPETQLNHVKLYSGALGLRSSVRITGGFAQNALQFPTKINAYDSFASATWATSLPTGGTTRFTADVNNTGLVLSQVHPGDYVNIQVSSFNAANKGTFVVKTVFSGYVSGQLVQYFDVIASNGAIQTGVVQADEADIQFFRPEKQTVYKESGRTVVVAQTQQKGFDIVIPATTAAVRRTQETAAYAQQRASIGASIKRNGAGELLIQTSVPHGLSVGNQIAIDSAAATFAASRFTPPTVTAAGAGVCEIGPTALWGTVSMPSGYAPYFSGFVAPLPNSHRVLVGGGNSGMGPLLDTCKIFSPVLTETDNGTRVDYTWEDAASLPTENEGQVVAVLNDGRIFTAGGVAGSPVLIYDETADTWTAGPIMPTVGIGSVALTLQDGRVFVVGSGTATPDGATAYYNPATNRVTAGVTMNTPYMNVNHVSQQKNGDVVVMGWDAGGYQAIQIFNGTSWTTIGTQDTPIQGAATHLDGIFVKLPDDRIFCVSTEFTTTSVVDPRYVTDFFVPKKGYFTVGPKFENPVDLAVPYIRADQGVVFPRIPGTAYDSDLVIFTPRNQNLSLTDQNSYFYDIKRGKFFTGPLLPSSMVGVGFNIHFNVNPIVSLGNGLVFIWGQASCSVFIPNKSMTYATGRVDSTATITEVTDSTHLKATQQGTPFLGYSQTATATISPLTAEASSIKGPYVLDPAAGPSVTSIEGQTVTRLAKNSRHATLELDTGSSATPALEFPDAPGWLVFDFGGPDEVYPVKYLGRFSNTALILDYSFRFPKTVPAGSKVTWLSSKGSFAPEDPKGVFYVTASNAGLQAALAALDLTVAEGVQAQTTITYPGDRGLGNEGRPTSGQRKLSDVVGIWAGNNVSADVNAARSS